MRFLPVLIFILLLPAADNAAAQQLPGQPAFAASLSQIAAFHDAAGMAVIGSCGSGQAEVYLGKRDIARNLPVTADTHFRIASVSKLVTALAVLHLHDEGALDLHQSAGSLLGFPLQNPAWPLHSIRVIDLLTHQSSIQDGSTYAAFLSESYSATAPPPISALLVPGSAWFAANNWRTEAPGSFFMYSNLNYGLLGSIIEAVTGQRFDRYMRDAFLPMLGIEGSFNPADLADINQLAALYRKPGGTWTPQFDHFQGVAPPDRELPGYVPGHNGLIFAPQGGLRTTARSLLQLARFLQQGGMAGGTQLISEETMAYLLEPQWTYSGGNGDPYFGLYYAFGAGAHHTTNRPGEDVVVPGHLFAGHPGAAYGLASNLYIRLGSEAGTAILFITNGVGAGFGFDQRSAFYTIETDVFETYATHILAHCLPSTHINDPESGLQEGPADFRVMPPFPNPFNSRTLLHWEMAVPAQMHITLHDLNGRLIRTLANQAFSAGRHTLPLEAADLSSGIYLLRFRNSSGQSATIRLTHLK
ncbi:MAG: serine hydrolase [Balneolales bacterium]|nr:serine hydrolase [Balneolales bacterium]